MVGEWGGGDLPKRTNRRELKINNFMVDGFLGSEKLVV